MLVWRLEIPGIALEPGVETGLEIALEVPEILGTAGVAGAAGTGTAEIVSTAAQASSYPKQPEPVYELELAPELDSPNHPRLPPGQEGPKFPKDSTGYSAATRSATVHIPVEAESHYPRVESRLAGPRPQAQGQEAGL